MFFQKRGVSVCVAIGAVKLVKFISSGAGKGLQGLAFTVMMSGILGKSRDFYRT
jgi:hypothetical protein